MRKKRVGGRAKQITMPDYSISNNYKTTCDKCGERAEYSWRNKKGRMRGACKKHLHKVK